MARRPERERGEAGVSTIEVVLAVPVIFAFMMTLVYLGFYAENIGRVQEAAADAARMASVQNGSDTVLSSARLAAWSDLSQTCNRDTKTTLGVTDSTLQIGLPPPPPGTPPPAQSYTATIKVTVTCDVAVLGIDYAISESAYAPLDYFRGQP